MTDAAGTWDDTTLSTPASLTAIEQEITEQKSVGDTTYSVTAGNVASAITPTAIDVSDGKKSMEIIGVAASTCVFSGFAITMQESDDDDTYTTYGTGLTIYSKSGTVTSGTVLFRWIVTSDFSDYLKPKVDVGSSTGTISIYANSVWGDKITLAKSILATDLRLLLVNNHILDGIDIETDEVLDCIYNPDTLGMASDFKTLELIYSDMARGSADNSLFWQKSIAYRKRYIEYLPKIVQNLIMDLNQDGENLVYYSALNFVPQAGR